MKSTNNENILIDAINDLMEISTSLKLKTYIWGGLVQDILEGELLREHDDIDAFTEELDVNINDIIPRLEMKKYQCKYDSVYSMLKARKNNIKISINPIQLRNGIVFWKHIGEKGFICFPSTWLLNNLYPFYKIDVFVSGIEFEYSFRLLSQYINPEWTIREKDKKALDYYEAKIHEKSITRLELLEKIWSFNPYWIEKGYDAFKAPVLVIGRDYA